MDELAAIRRELTSVRTVVLIPYLEDRPAVEGTVAWCELVARLAPLAFASLPFAHPLYILFSSGTTGLPKPIVHGHGGILIEHKEESLPTKFLNRDHTSVKNRL